MIVINPQTPAEGILLQQDFGDSKFYKIACTCGNTDDDISLNIEADEGGITIHHSVTVKTAWWETPTKYTWLNGLLHRIKMTYRIWIYGYLEYESFTMMTSQQAINYAETMKTATNDVAEFRNKQYK